MAPAKTPGFRPVHAGHRRDEALYVLTDRQPICRNIISSSRPGYMSFIMLALCIRGSTAQKECPPEACPTDSYCLNDCFGGLCLGAGCYFEPPSPHPPPPSPRPPPPSPPPPPPPPPLPPFPPCEAHPWRCPEPAGVPLKKPQATQRSEDVLPQEGIDPP